MYKKKEKVFTDLFDYCVPTQTELRYKVYFNRVNCVTITENLD